jgi:hypothetical protein
VSTLLLSPFSFAYFAFDYFIAIFTAEPPLILMTFADIFAAPDFMAGCRLPCHIGSFEPLRRHAMRFRRFRRRHYYDSFRHYIIFFALPSSHCRWLPTFSFSFQYFRHISFRCFGFEFSLTYY